MELTPTLLTFCYIKDAFDKSGDVMLGLAPIFLPIASKLRGKEFEPAEFVKEAQSFYGISMSESVAEELAVRLNTAGYLRAEKDGAFVQKFFYKDDYADLLKSQIPDVPAVEAQIDALIGHVRAEFLKVFPQCSDYPIEQEILTALANLNFSRELTEVQGESPNTPAAAAPAPASDREKKEANAIRILVAEYIYEAKASDPTRFDALLSIASGALLAQVVATVKRPPVRGVAAMQLTIYFDTPMVLQYFDFEGAEKRQAVSEIMSALKEINAKWGVYRENVQEMQALLKAVLTSIDQSGRADFEVGRSVTASAHLRTRARALLQNPDGLLKKAGFRILDTTGFSEKVRSAVPSRFERDLTVRIRPGRRIESREVDASAVCDTVRQRQDNRVSEYLKAFALFVSPNTDLIAVADEGLRASGLLVTGEVSYVLTMAQLAGILWVAVGAGGAELPMKTLLANCVAALASNQAIIKRMREIVGSLGEAEAREFEGIIANDRCAYYLTKLTIGGPVLLTKETGLQVFEQLRRRVEFDAERIAAEKYDKALAERDQDHALKLDELSAELAQQKDDSGKALGAAQDALTQMGDKFKELEAAIAAISRQKEITEVALITNCRTFRRRVEFALSSTFALASAAIGFLAGQFASGLPVWAVASITIVCGALGFHVVPNFIFGGIIEKRGERAFLSKARALTIEPLALEILANERKEEARRSK